MCSSPNLGLDEKSGKRSLGAFEDFSPLNLEMLALSHPYFTKILI